LHNALKYTNKGSVTVQVSLDNTKGKQRLIIKVADTGIGIRPEHLGIIFEEFRQGSEGLNRTFEGTGLGLTITKKSVELLGGTLSVESELGTGSVFTVSLPLGNTDSASGDDSKTENMIKAGDSDTKTRIPHKILVVENDDISRGFIGHSLKDFCTVVFAVDGYDAITLASEYRYHLILMDIGLGGNMNGMEATNQIRRLPGYKDTPIIAVTAYASQEDKALFLSNGMTHFLSKPFTKKQLLNILTEILTENS
jgi:CheY-like chemotaxis protein